MTEVKKHADHPDDPGVYVEKLFDYDDTTRQGTYAVHVASATGVRTLAYEGPSGALADVAYYGVVTGWLDSMSAFSRG